MASLFREIVKLFTHKQTYLNLAYLGLNVGLGFAYSLIYLVCLSIAWGLIFPNIVLLASVDWVAQIKLVLVVLGGVLIVPCLVWVMQVFVVPEQWLANVLVKENIAIDRQMWSKESSLLKPRQLFLEGSTWKRLLYTVLKIPLGGVSFFAFFNVLVPALALFGMPLVYLAGFRNLIIGPWRFDTVEKAALAFLAGVILLPPSLFAMNLLAKFSGWLAKTLLAAPAGRADSIDPAQNLGDLGT